MSPCRLFVALRVLAFFAATSMLLLGGCASDPWTQAAHDMDRQAFERQIAAAKDVQTGRNEALLTALYWTRVREPHRSFHTKLYKDLLAAGANPNQVVDSVITLAGFNPYAIDLLKETGFDLNARGADGNALINTAASLGAVESVERLIAHRVDLDNRGGINNATPLGMAVMQWAETPAEPGMVPPGYVAYQADRIEKAGKIAKLLVAAGARVDARQFEDDRTPAMQAALSNRSDIVNFLVSKGANPKLKDKDGDDVESYLAMGRRKNDARLAKKQAEQQAARERRELLGQLAGTVAAAAVVSNVSMPTASKAQLVSAVASDLGTGGALATNSVANSQGGSRPAASRAPSAKAESQLSATTPKQAQAKASSRSNMQAADLSEQRDPTNSDVGFTGPRGRKKIVREGWLGAGVTRATSELAIADGIEQAKKDAEEWVAKLGNGRYHGVLTGYRVVRCDAMGGNPLYRRCALDITYEVDDIP